jgi:hypothetical protein
MAHFFRPPGESGDGYLVDRKFAPDSVGLLDIAEGSTKRIALWGGSQLWVKSMHPDVVPNPIIVRPLTGDVVIVTLEGNKPGSATIETGTGNSRSVSLEVRVNAAPKATLIPEELGSKPFPVDFLQQASVNFSVGFAEGLVAKIDGSLGKELSDKILAKKLDFYIGYVTGVLKGLLGGLVSLLTLLYDVAKMSASVSLPGAMASLATEAYQVMTSSTHREMRKLQIETAQKLIALFTGILNEIKNRPMLYISSSRSSGVVLGSELAVYINVSARNSSASQLGVFTGEIVGRVLFEIIIFIVMAMVTGGAGEAARGGLALGEGAEGAKTYAGLLKKLMEVLEEMPAIRKLIAELFEAKGLSVGTKAAEAVRAKEVLQVAKQAASSASMSAGEKAAALEKVFTEISAADTSWHFKRRRALGCQALFTGEQRPFGLLVDNQGVLWETLDFHVAGKYGEAGGAFQYVPDFAKWDRVP